MFRKILVALDGSEGSRKALASAIYLASACGAELHSISVETRLPRYAATVGEYEEVKEQRDAFYKKVADEAVAAAQGSGVALTPHIEAGNPVEAIVTLLREGKFDTLLVGFTGHSRIFERVWGGTSQNLARLAPCTVVVVK